MATTTSSKPRPGASLKPKSISLQDASVGSEILYRHSQTREQIPGKVLAHDPNWPDRVLVQRPSGTTCWMLLTTLSKKPA